MLCPNCKQELMNINGRYICVDCGTEVPENEVPTAQAEHDGVEAKVTGNDYLYSEMDKPVESPQADPVETVPEPVEEVPIQAPEIEPEVATSAELPVSELLETPVPVVDLPEVATQNAPEQPIETPAPPVVAEEEVSTPDLPVESEITQEPVEETAPADLSIPETTVVEPVLADTPVLAPAGMAPEVAEEPVASTPPTTFDTINPIETPVAPSVPPVPLESVQTESLGAPQEELVPIPEATPAASTAETVNAMDNLEQETTTPAPTMGEYNFSSASQVPEDKTIYQNPLFDQQATAVEPIAQPIEETEIYQQMNKRRLIILVSLGAIGLITLIIIGIFVFNALTKQAVVTPVTSTDVVDCGSSGPGIADSTTAQSCFTQSFSECKLAKFNASIDLGALGGSVTYAYEIKGKTDNSCTVSSKFTENPNPNWVNKTMSCELDNTKTFDEAYKTISADNCTGPLADLMFNTTNSSATDNTNNQTSGN